MGIGEAPYPTNASRARIKRARASTPLKDWGADVSQGCQRELKIAHCERQPRLWV